MNFCLKGIVEATLDPGEPKPPPTLSNFFCQIFSHKSNSGNSRNVDESDFLGIEKFNKLSESEKDSAVLMRIKSSGKN